jgi:hypothetical protein
MTQFKPGDILYSPIRGDVVKIKSIGEGCYWTIQLTEWQEIEVGGVYSDSFETFASCEYELLSEEMKARLI